METGETDKLSKIPPPAPLNCVLAVASFRTHRHGGSFNILYSFKLRVPTQNWNLTVDDKQTPSEHLLYFIEHNLPRENKYSQNYWNIPLKLSAYQMKKSQLQIGPWMWLMIIYQMFGLWIYFSPLLFGPGGEWGFTEVWLYTATQMWSLQSFPNHIWIIP